MLDFSGSQKELVVEVDIVVSVIEAHMVVEAEDSTYYYSNMKGLMVSQPWIVGVRIWVKLIPRL